MCAHTYSSKQNSLILVNTQKLLQHFKLKYYYEETDYALAASGALTTWKLVALFSLSFSVLYNSIAYYIKYFHNVRNLLVHWLYLNA